jgi:hypothetical protein
MSASHVHPDEGPSADTHATAQGKAAEAVAAERVLDPDNYKELQMQ